MPVIRQRLILILALSLVFISLVYLHPRASLGTKPLAPVHKEGDEAAPTRTNSLTGERLDKLRQDVSTHPITHLIAQAREAHLRNLSQRSHDVRTAAERYRERRKQHPPPGFDAWAAYAQEHDVVVIESFFDRIYDDLRPFWALPALQLQKESHPLHWDQVISIRDGQAYLKSEGNDPMNRMSHWMRLLEELAPHLPDLDMPFNVMDESRVLVPLQEIDEMVQKHPGDLLAIASGSVVRESSGLPALEDVPLGFEEPVDWHWITSDSNAIWNIVAQGCPPDTPAFDTHAIDVERDPPVFAVGQPLHSYHGYVQNWTLASDPCQHPDLRTLHGAFIEPVSVSTTQRLAPLFGGSKLPMNNEILIPAAMYLSTEELYAGGEATGPEWHDKTAGVVWRGVASGGRNKAETWTHFHRHRFLQMLNTTAVEQIESGELTLGVNSTFNLPETRAFPFLTAFDESVSTWFKQVPIDAAFNHMWCFPGQPDPIGHKCAYTDDFFTPGPLVPMAEQYRYRFLPDIDGNSFSARFRAFLKSTSLPIKASIYAEWHDARLVPWVHFVPMDNSFVDFYGVLDYLLADDLVADHHNVTEAGGKSYRSAGEAMATDGKLWADQVLRREDMVIYTWRLLLEWARVCDEQREKLGWIDDLLETP